MAGNLTSEDLHRYKDEAGITLWDALSGTGYQPENLVSARRTREMVKCYLEMHIEQGRVLEDSSKRIGIVTAIAAPTRFQVSITGRADHSGATPMGMRRDALCAAADLILALEQYGTEESPHSSVATVGNIRVEPGSMVVIPGKATMSVDIRGIESSSKGRIVRNTELKIAQIRKERNVEIDIEPIHDAEPVPLSAKIIGVIKEVCDQLGIDALLMPSGAGHDAQQIATFTDAGMIFVPSVEGLSHSPEEYTHIEDIALGIELLAHVLLKLSGQAAQKV
jgi:N-carbamoyl-L-amino-acid hydrolase